jgi:hypothetical protein
MTDRSVDTWTTAIEIELGLEGQVDSAQGLNAISDLGGDVRKYVDPDAVARTAYLVGVAAGRAQEPSIAAQDIAQKLGAMARGWDSDAERGVPSNDQEQRG